MKNILGGLGRIALFTGTTLLIACNSIPEAKDPAKQALLKCVGASDKVSVIGSVNPFKILGKLKTEESEVLKNNPMVSMALAMAGEYKDPVVSGVELNRNLHFAAKIDLENKSGYGFAFLTLHNKKKFEGQLSALPNFNDIKENDTYKYLLVNSSLGLAWNDEVVGLVVSPFIPSLSTYADEIMQYATLTGQANQNVVEFVERNDDVNFLFSYSGLGEVYTLAGQPNMNNIFDDIKEGYGQMTLNFEGPELILVGESKGVKDVEKINYLADGMPNDFVGFLGEGEPIAVGSVALDWKKALDMFGETWLEQVDDYKKLGDSAAQNINITMEDLQKMFSGSIAFSLNKIGIKEVGSNDGEAVTVEPGIDFNLVASISEPEYVVAKIKKFDDSLVIEKNNHGNYLINVDRKENVWLAITSDKMILTANKDVATVLANGGKLSGVSGKGVDLALGHSTAFYYRYPSEKDVNAVMQLLGNNPNSRQFSEIFNLFEEVTSFSDVDRAECVIKFKCGNQNAITKLVEVFLKAATAIQMQDGGEIDEYQEMLDEMEKEGMNA